ncbi:MAG: HAMP domain-containing protein [Chloroflexi bacterium]|nr:HAMP domain-containing protein [Chloroflexota bacterium]
MRETLLESDHPLPVSHHRGWARFLRLDRLKYQLILPYVFLTMILAVSGMYVITRLVAYSQRDAFENNLLNASRITNDSLVRQEQEQLERLRPIVFTSGLAQALFDGDHDKVHELLEPIFINSPADVLTAVDAQSREVVTYGRYLGQNGYHTTQGADFSTLPIVQKTLSEAADVTGDKFVDLIRLEQGYTLVTSAPVRDSSGKTVGVMMIGSYLENLMTELKKQALAEIIFVDMNGQVFETTFTGQEEGFEQLQAAVQSLDASTPAAPIPVLLDKREYEVVYSPLVIRGQQVGWIGVVKDSVYLVRSLTTSRNVILLIFLIGAVGVAIIGFWQAENISRPILRLREMAQRVAAGDLNQQIGLRRTDEVGELAEAFDTMTSQLRSRTDEAARLYAESLQRNKELAEINARLETTQQQLIQSEKLAAIGQLTAGIVHDVKNPFAVIMGMAEVLAEDETLDPEVLHGLKTIRESAVKGNNIVSDLLKFARQSQPEMRYLDMCETVNAAIRLTAYLTRRYNFTTSLPEKPLMMVYDAQQIEQVLINLIHNAVQAMPNGGALHISLEDLGETARIRIKDTGCGIEPEAMKRIFDPFFTTKSEGEGTGLGLSVSYGIISTHRGQIQVESEVGKGSVFTILLPITKPSYTDEEL